MKINRYVVGLLLLLVGCTAGHKVMTMDSFQEVPVGMTDLQLKEDMGSPFSVHKMGDNEYKYVYIERIEQGKRLIVARYYYFILKDGKVVDKWVQQLPGPTGIRNSYEMQTSDNKLSKEEKNQ